MNTHRLAAAVAEQFDFAKLVFLPNEAGTVVPMSRPTTISSACCGVELSIMGSVVRSLGSGR